MRRAYVDSCLFIYWVERAAPQTQAAQHWLEGNADANLCISPLVRMEILVKPMRLQQLSLIQAYETLLEAQTWLTINDRIFARALALRSRFGLKTPDALHLATAQQYGCDELWTNDNRLKSAAGSMAVNVHAPLLPSLRTTCGAPVRATAARARHRARQPQQNRAGLTP